LRCLALGGHPHQSLGVLIGTGVGEHFDIDRVAPKPKLFEGKTDRLFDRIRLNLNARHPVIHLISLLVQA